MNDDSVLLKTLRAAAVLLGVGLLILGVVVFDGGIFDSLLPDWGWLLGAVVGGGTMGAGLGMGAAGITGENRFLDRLRAREEAGSLNAATEADRIGGPGADEARSGGPDHTSRRGPGNTPDCGRTQDRDSRRTPDTGKTLDAERNPDR